MSDIAQKISPASFFVSMGIPYCCFHAPSSLMSSSWPDDTRQANRAPVLSGRRTSRATSIVDVARNGSSSNLGSSSNGNDDGGGRRRTPVGSQPRAAARLTKAGFAALQPPRVSGTSVKVMAVAAGTILFGIASIGFSLAFQPTWLVKWIQKQRKDLLFLKPTTDLVVALTIDDGPHEDITPELLDILKENQSRATFFIIGHNMDRCPHLVERIHREGHEVGNHTMFDEPSWRLPLTDFEQQLIAVDNRLSRFYYCDSDNNPIKWFRPGYGFFTNSMVDLAKAHGYRTVLGSLFPFDNLFTNQGKVIAQYLLRRIHPGAIIVLHDREPQKQQTADILRKLLPGLRRQGYSVCSITDLLDLRGTKTQ